MELMNKIYLDEEARPVPGTKHQSLELKELEMLFWIGNSEPVEKKPEYC